MDQTTSGLYMWDYNETYLAGRLRTIEKLLGMCEWIPREELLVRVSHPHARELVAGWEAKKEIFSIPSAEGALYPLFAFDAQMKPLPIIKAILTELEGDDPYAIASWFTMKNDWITEIVAGTAAAAAPMCTLEDYDRLLTAARNEKGTYFA
jgi:hypothetical protein